MEQDEKDEICCPPLNAAFETLKNRCPVPKDKFARKQDSLTFQSTYTVNDATEKVYELKSGSFPSPEVFFIGKCLLCLWFPEAFIPALRNPSYVYCKHCKCSDKISHEGWMQKPRRVVSKHKVYFVLGRMYRCGKCSKTFNNLCVEVFGRLPEWIQDKLPFIFTHRGGIAR